MLAQDGSNVKIDQYRMSIRNNRITFRIGNIVVIPFRVTPGNNLQDEIKLQTRNAFHTLIFGSTEQTKYERLLISSLSKLHTIKVLEPKRKLQLITDKHNIYLTNFK